MSAVGFFSSSIAHSEVPINVSITTTAVDAATNVQSGSGSVPTESESAKPKAAFTTGVAKGRDMLDTAISASTLEESEIQKYGARSLGEIFRNIPGIRSKAAGGDANANFTIRGLPAAGGGAKFLQIQEDGLPVFEFGDIPFSTADNFLRADLNLSQIQTIRGGSASTFASNSPGGVINLISRTGEIDGGTIQQTLGLDYEEFRTDMDYGAKISDTIRFHVGGFFRQGEGPRHLGFDGFKGGQVKVNVTKDFTGGYIRFYGKILDDRTPVYLQYPIAVSGTNDDPTYEVLPNFDARKDTLFSRYQAGNVTFDRNNNLIRTSMSDGMHAKMKSIGFETQFELGRWTFTERFRHSDASGHYISNWIAPGGLGTAQAIADKIGGAGSTLSYATGPNAGLMISEPAALNGNGLLAQVYLWDLDQNNLDNTTNDMRISRVWDIGQGKLTTTGGFYRATQSIGVAYQWSQQLLEVLGGGNAALINVTRANGTPASQDGFFVYGTTNGRRRNILDLEYTVNAPYASLNYKIGNLSVGASLRYDSGKARGQIFGVDLGEGRTGTISYDMNGNGIISGPETAVSVFPLSRPAPVNYDYDYVSYSLSANYRFNDSFSTFGRYSKGARANADRILFVDPTPYVSKVDGSLLDPEAAFDAVKQAEIGVKFRTDHLSFYVTGFWAESREHNLAIDRTYQAKGVEFEGSIAYGPFSLYSGATYADAEIKSDKNPANAALVGNIPKQQPKLLYFATPQASFGWVKVGANLIGTTSSYSADTNQLKMPGYATVGAFVQLRPSERIVMTLNTNNLFNVKGLYEVDDATMPAIGATTARMISGRTISASLRFTF
jgi:outer membrane receptor protein involved in Fe transport